MKKITFLLLALFVVATTAMAQQRERGERPSKDPAEHAQQMTDRMTKSYSLSDEQKEKVYAINLERAQKMTPPAREKSSDDAKPTEEEMKARREEMKTTQEAYNAKLKEVLTSEQYEAYTKDQANHQRGPRKK